MKINRLLASVLGFVLVVGLGATAFAQTPELDLLPRTSSPVFSPTVDEADIIFFGGEGKGVTAFAMDGLTTGQSRLAEDFELQEKTLVTDVHLDINQFEPQIAEFEFFIYEDDAGTPGNEISSGNAINVHRMDSGDGIFFRYWFDLDNPVLLDANTRYWITVRVTNGITPINFGWDTTDFVFGSGFAFTHDDGANWFFQPLPANKLNLVLTGPPPDVVGGEFLPIDSAALLLAGLQTSAIWMLPVLAGAVGVGAYYIKTRMNKE